VCNVVRLGLLRAPFYVTDRLLGSRALGLYALADYVMNLLWRPAGIAGQVLLASASIDRGATGTNVVAWLSRVLSAATACALLAIGVLGTRGVAAVFGQAFGDTYMILVAAAPGIWAYSVGIAVDYYYAAHDYPWTLGVAFVAGAVTTVIGSLLVAGTWGLVGVAAAYGLSLVLVFLIIDGSFVRRTGVAWASLLFPRPSDWSAVRALWRRTS
jgi:O-antigen/teichoic acid export membrane protein